MTLFFRILDATVEDKPRALRDAINRVAAERVYTVDPSVFTNVAGAPFAYWICTGAIEAFAEIPPFERDGRVARVTNPLGDNLRFTRLSWEIDPRTREFDRNRTVAVPLCKGGSFSPFYYDPHLLVYWDKERESYFGFVGTEHRPLVRPASSQYFFRPGLTWPIRTSGLSFRVMPAGCIFGSKGPAAFTDADDPDEALALCALMNSSVFSYLVGVQLARTELAQSYEVGLIQQTPVPMLSEIDRKALADLAKRAWSFKRAIDTGQETSHAFTLPLSLQRRLPAFQRLDDATLNGIQTEIDEIAFRIYGMSSADRVAIVDWHRAQNPKANDADQTDATGADEGDDSEGEEIPTGDSDAILSWAVGVAFGRFDLRLATGERELSFSPDPFDPLPTKSEGMVPDGDAPFDYSSDILVDDPGHPEDLIARVVAVYEHVGVDAPDTNTIRDNLRRAFFARHIKMYSRSRRTAPIYWQLSTASGSYSVWIYIHKTTSDTLFRVQNEFLGPKLSRERRQLEELRVEAGPNPDGKSRKAIEAQEAFVEELQAFSDEVKRASPLWNADLDDGVIVNSAPFWRLVPQPRGWQKDLRSMWDSLCQGGHDWTQMAMRCWPERVVPKCAADRSLAIAHGLEDIFWSESADGKWQPRAKPGKSIADLTLERTSSVITAALKAVTETPASISKRTRKSR